MVARAIGFVAIAPGASFAISSARLTALPSPGDSSDRRSQHSGSALPESMASLSGNGRAGGLFHDVRISVTHPRRSTIFAGRHVIIGFQLEIYNSTPVRNALRGGRHGYLSG
jgi:hypothetical protein